MNLQEHRSERINFVFKLYLMKLDKEQIASELAELQRSTDISEEAIKLLESICARLPKYEDLLKQHLPKDWKWDRINNIEKSILINSVAEIVDHKNPKAIVINEAVEYSKKYADQYSYKLINGVLDNFKQPK